jgi:hypothetical protein
MICDRLQKFRGPEYVLSCKNNPSSTAVHKGVRDILTLAGKEPAVFETKIFAKTEEQIFRAIVRHPPHSALGLQKSTCALTRPTVAISGFVWEAFAKFEQYVEWATEFGDPVEDYVDLWDGGSTPTYEQRNQHIAQELVAKHREAAMKSRRPISTDLKFYSFTDNIVMRSNVMRGQMTSTTSHVPSATHVMLAKALAPKHGTQTDPRNGAAIYVAILPPVDCPAIITHQCYVGKAEGGTYNRWIPDKNSHLKRVCEIMQDVQDGVRPSGYMLVDLSLAMLWITTGTWDDVHIATVSHIPAQSTIDKTEKTHIKAYDCMNMRDGMNSFETINDDTAPASAAAPQ